MRHQSMREHARGNGSIVTTMRRRGIVALAVSLANPKVVLFFVAFFPLFLRPGSSGATLVAMMAHVTLISFVYQAGLVLVGNAVALRLRAFPAARRIAAGLAGIALIGFGVKLAVEQIWAAEQAPGSYSGFEQQEGRQT